MERVAQTRVDGATTGQEAELPYFHEVRHPPKFDGLAETLVSTMMSPVRGCGTAVAAAVLVASVEASSPLHLLRELVDRLPKFPSARDRHAQMRRSRGHLNTARNTTAFLTESRIKNTTPVDNVGSATMQIYQHGTDKKHFVRRRLQKVWTEKETQLREG